MVLTGSLNTISIKMMLTTESTNEDGDTAPFEKPWFATLACMLAMTLVGAMDKCIRCCRAKSLEVDADLAPEGPKDQTGVAGKSYWQKVLLVVVPSSCDVGATGLGCIGFIYTPASVWQMLRGAAMIFGALFSIVFLKRRLHTFNWIGLLFAVSGLALVGLSSLLGDADQPKLTTTSTLAFGMAVTVLAQAVAAGQIVAEEWLLKDVDLPAMQLVGWEGLWSTLLMLCVVYPLLGSIPGHDHGVMESPHDTLAMLWNGSYLQGLVVVYVISCGTFNATAVAVTGALSGIHRMMLDATRTVVIWIFGLTVYYIDQTSPFGEAWTRYSILQCAGFVLLVLGQAVYGGVLKLPGVYYPANDVETSKSTVDAGEEA